MYTEINPTNEDRIRDIYEKVAQIKSFILIMQSATENEYNPPEGIDFQKALEMMYNHTDNILQNINNYIDFCTRQLNSKK